MFSIIGGFLVLILVMVFLYGKWGSDLNEEQKSFLKGIPGPVYYPLVGNSLEFSSPTDLLPRFIEYAEKYGDVVKIWFSHLNLKILLSGYREAEVILSSNKHLEKTDDYGHFQRWLGDGLLTSGKYRWKKFRRILTPAFHFRILEHFIESFEGPTGILIDKLCKLTSEKSFDIHSVISLCSLDMICESSMGIAVNAQTDSSSEYVRCISEIGVIGMKRNTSMFTYLDFFFKFTKDYQRETEVINTLHSFTNKVIKQRKHMLADRIDEAEDFDMESYGKKKLTFLDLLLLSKVDGKPIPESVIREEVDTFMFAGHDTTGSAMSFMLYLLADHPDIQEKLYEEQTELFGNEKNPKITLNELQEMKLMDWSIKETLRLYPPAPFVGRVLEEDLYIDGKKYPKGLGCYINIYGMHRRADYFDNPEKFDPMRFSNMKAKSPYVYIPFSAGPRNCIGQRYAILEMKYVISSIVRHFRVKPATPREELQPVVELVLKNANGVYISLEKRA